MTSFYNHEKKTLFNVRLDYWICLFLVVSILCVYWQVHTFSFLNYDDDEYVTHNYYVKSGVTLNSLYWSMTAVHASNWHPLTWISHMLDCEIYGMNPGQHHMTNVLFHIFNVLLLFLVLRKMTEEVWKSAFVAALFALHPLHVESVAWVAERKDVLSTFFLMLTLWSYTRYVEHSGFDKYLLLILFYIFGLMAKPMLVTLPFVLLLLDYWPLKRFQLMRPNNENRATHKPFYFGLIWEKLPLFLLSLTSCVVTYLAQKSSGAVNSLAAIPLHDRIPNALASYVGYIEKMLWPNHLAVLYPYPESIALWRVLGSCLLLSMVSIAVFRMIRSKPYYVVGWLWYLGTLVPVIGLVQVGMQAMADRYTYVPLIGIFIMITWGVPDILYRWRFKRMVLGILLVGLIPTFIATTWLQLQHWQNSVKLFTHALKVTRNNSIAHCNLGNALSKQEKYNEAKIHYVKALEINPNYVQAHNDMGYLLGQQGNYKDAIYHYNEAFRISPNDVKIHNNFGVLLAQQGNFKDAVYQYNKVLQNNPKYVGAYYNLGKLYANQGNTETAIHYYSKALLLNPNMTQVLYNMSWIFATHQNTKFRNGEEAIKLAEKLCKITQYNQPLALDALAAAYAETGRFKSAVLIAQKAFKLALSYGPKELALGIKKRLELYKKEQPYRQNLNNKNES